MTRQGIEQSHILCPLLSNVWLTQTWVLTAALSPYTVTSATALSWPYCSLSPGPLGNFYFFTSYIMNVLNVYKYGIILRKNEDKLYIYIYAYTCIYISPHTLWTHIYILNIQIYTLCTHVCMMYVYLYI